jgi:hypothetical protein
LATHPTLIDQPTVRDANDANQAGAQSWLIPMSLAPLFIPMMMDGLLLLMSLQLRQAEAEIQCVLL